MSCSSLGLLRLTIGIGLGVTRSMIDRVETSHKPSLCVGLGVVRLTSSNFECACGASCSS